MDVTDSPIGQALTQRLLAADTPRATGVVAVMNVEHENGQAIIISLSCPAGCCTANFALEVEQAEAVATGLTAAVADAKNQVN